MKAEKIKTCRGYEVRIPIGNGFHEYVTGYYKGKYEFCTDFTYAKKFSERTADEHLRRLNKGTEQKIYYCEIYRYGACLEVVGGSREGCKAAMLKEYRAAYKRFNNGEAVPKDLLKEIKEAIDEGIREYEPFKVEWR